MKKKIYTAEYELGSDGYWGVVVRVSPKEAAISDGQTLSKARRRIRQSLAALLDVPENSFEIVDDIRLGAPARRAVSKLRTAQAAAEKASSDAKAAAANAAKALAVLGMSRRDAGEVLGVTGARVQQLVGR